MLNEPTETKEEKRMRKGMRKAGGILTIVGGIIMLVGGTFAAGIPLALIPLSTAPAGVAGGFIALGVFTLIGGIYAIRGRKWGLALAGAICAAFPAAPAGALAIVFISITKREFE